MNLFHHPIITEIFPLSIQPIGIVVWIFPSVTPWAIINHGDHIVGYWSQMVAIFSFCLFKIYHHVVEWLSASCGRVIVCPLSFLWRHSAKTPDHSVWFFLPVHTGGCWIFEFLLPLSPSHKKLVAAIHFSFHGDRLCERERDDLDSIFKSVVHTFSTHPNVSQTTDFDSREVVAKWIRATFSVRKVHPF